MPTTETTALEDAVFMEALRGLSATPKTLAPWLFYDERGSHLFDAITELPEYYLTRTERGIFTDHASEIREATGTFATIAELGAGSAGKTGILLSEFATHQPSLLYQPIDVSATALQDAAAALSEAIPGIRIESQVANYITERYNIKRPSSGKVAARVLALYIGSSIGNFAPEEAAAILRNLREHLEPNDVLLLGVDLAPGKQKTVDTLLAAYDDAAGVTAEFNKNVLTRLNRELNADFAVDCFVHRARWNAAASRMEMHLESLVDQVVTIAGHKFHFRAGETIHTENSYKFSGDRLHALLNDAGFALDREFHDAQDKFAVVLGRAV